MTNRRTDQAGLDFTQQAQLKPRSTARELWDLIRFNKKWWLTPIILMLLVFSVLMIIGGSAAAPFIYTLF